MTGERLDILGMESVPVLNKGTKAQGVKVLPWHLAEIQGRKIDELISNIERSVETNKRNRQRINDMKDHDYQQKADEFKRDVTTIRGRAVQAYHQYIPPSLRVTFWIVFAVVCLVVAGFIRAVTPL